MAAPRAWLSPEAVIDVGRNIRPVFFQNTTFIDSYRPCDGYLRQRAGQSLVGFFFLPTGRCQDMETLCKLLGLCVGKSPITGNVDSHHKEPVIWI